MAKMLKHLTDRQKSLLRAAKDRILAGVENADEQATEEQAEEALYLDTGKYDEEHENHLRGELELWANYAEDGPTFDPDGKYLCDSCDMRKAPDQCIRIEGPINFDVGGCRIYVFGKEPETGDMPQKLTQIQAMYSERPESKGFGCSRCEYSAEAKKEDSAGRPSWCRFWGLHIIPNACCMMNDAEDDISAPGEK